MIGLILCAGLGTRLKEETKDKPKCMVEVGGKPVLERVADHMNKNGIQRIVVNLNKFPEVVMKHFGQRFLYLYEPVPMGEFATINLVRSMFPGEMITVMNGDTITNVEIKPVYSNTRIYSKTTGHHIGTSIYEPNRRLDAFQRINVDCEYYDIGTPEGLKRARKRYK